jgi:hypothetical protein
VRAIIGEYLADNPEAFNAELAALQAVEWWKTDTVDGLLERCRSAARYWRAEVARLRSQVSISHVAERINLNAAKAAKFDCQQAEAALARVVEAFTDGDLHGYECGHGVPLDEACDEPECSLQPVRAALAEQPESKEGKP